MKIRRAWLTAWSKQITGWAPATQRFNVTSLVVGLVFGLGFSPAWRASVAAGQLHVRWHTPARLMRFLEDARERNVLRTVGSVYQFRHARLQDRLAGIKAEADKAAGRYRD
jgi:hypothetical protein